LTTCALLANEAHTRAIAAEARIHKFDICKLLKGCRREVLGYTVPIRVLFDHPASQGLRIPSSAWHGRQPRFGGRDRHRRKRIAASAGKPKPRVRGGSITRRGWLEKAFFAMSAVGVFVGALAYVHL
jgi:hypothetical protein